MAKYEIDRSVEMPRIAGPGTGDGVAKAVLYENACWFTKVRWGAIGVLVLIGVMGRVAPEGIRLMGLVPPTGWPWIMAGMLAVANASFYLIDYRLDGNADRRLIETNIWLQIVIDLVALTAFVHIAGSTDSMVGSLYLLHITLASIFFGQRQSLKVIALAAFLYAGCVGLEVVGVLPRRCVFAMPVVQRHDPLLAGLLVGIAVFVWVAVWYLVGTLSRAVRDRDRKLEAANERLIKADEMMNRQVLRTTHDLKSPFCGMQSNIQILRMKHWEGIPEDARAILERIERRGQTLSRRIGDILLLGEIRSQKRAAPETVNLRSVVQTAVDDVTESAQHRGITLTTQVPDVSVTGNQRQFTLLFSNLLSNAVTYSHNGGSVDVSAHREDGCVWVSIADHGIGISEKALPSIFDEYFRTKQAMETNAMSTGLGLAIVKRIAQDFDLSVRVTSEMDKGTTFEVAFPLVEGTTQNRSPGGGKATDD